MLLLTADWHLTDRPQDEYRWTVFAAIKRLIAQHGITDIFVLGDLADKKDRHTGAFVLRVLDATENLDRPVTVLMGNHDKPVMGASVWNVLNRSDNMMFFDKPSLDGKVALLPFTPDPETDWADINFSKFKAAFMHQPLDGAVVGGHKIKGTGLPLMPRGIKLFSGDIHDPQRVGRVEYVGAPHHVTYGDTHKCRMLVLDYNFDVKHEIILTPPAKQLVDIVSVDTLDALNLQPGDQIRVRLTLEPDKLKEYAAQERKIMAWAIEAGVHVTGLETRVIEDAGHVVEVSASNDPQAVLDDWAKGESLDDLRLEYGRTLLGTALGK